MNKVVKTFAMVLALCGSALTAAAGATQGGGGAGKVSYSDLSVMMSTEAKDNSHKEAIEIASWSVTPGTNGVVQIVASAVPASVARLCQSRAPLPSVVIESDGKRHVFRNVVFDKCPTGGSAGTYTLTFDAQGRIYVGTDAGVFDRPDTTIAGLTASKIDARPSR